MSRKQIFIIGVALFAMFFGAGNVVFPLDLGRVMGDKVWPAIAGFFLSAVIIPFVGVFDGALFKGDYRAYFRRIGTIPGELLALLCMVLIGPFGAIPRTLTLSHASLAWYFPRLPLSLFTVLAGLIILFFTVRKGKIVDIIGKYLGPLKIGLLSAIIVAGFFVEPTTIVTTFTPWQGFFSGLIEGYYILDLLGAIFLSKLIFNSIKKVPGMNTSDKQILWDLVKACCIGALLLGIVYIGFMITSAYHGSQIPAVGKDQLICALADFLLGRFGILAGFTVAIACLTTAIALTAIFADYLSIELFRNKLPYNIAVVMAVFVTCAFANLGFDGIMNAILPFILISYPAMIVLAVLNVAYKLFNFKPVRIPVYITLLLAALHYFKVI
jgi:LIVCS family branched-chain amino acid:cation transporter